jgi:hypothetical protein
MPAIGLTKKPIFKPIILLEYLLFWLILCYVDEKKHSVALSAMI